METNPYLEFIAACQRKGVKAESRVLDIWERAASWRPNPKLRPLTRKGTFAKQERASL